MHHPTDRIAHTTAFGTPVVEHWLEREIIMLKYAEHTSTISAVSVANPEYPLGVRGGGGGGLGQ